MDFLVQCLYYYTIILVKYNILSGWRNAYSTELIFYGKRCLVEERFFSVVYFTIDQIVTWK